MKLPPQIVDMLAPGPNEARVLVLEHEHPIALQLQGWIDKHERARCRRFQDERDRLGAAVTWGLLRFGIGVLTGCDPLEARIRRDSYGRPQIEGVSRDRMDLNVSRRRGCSVLVLARGVRCGVDIERIEPDLLSDELLQTLLSRSEIDRAGGGAPGRRARFERWDSGGDADQRGSGPCGAMAVWGANLENTPDPYPLGVRRTGGGYCRLCSMRSDPGRADRETRANAQCLRGS